MRRSMPLLFLLTTAACGALPEPLSRPFELASLQPELNPTASVRRLLGARLPAWAWSARASGSGDQGGAPHAPGETARRTVHVYVPSRVEAAGARAPMLYLGDTEARFFPAGAGDASHSVVPSPSELVALVQRQDIVIVAVDSEPLIPAVTPDGRTHYITHMATRPPPT